MKGKLLLRNAVITLVACASGFPSLALQHPLSHPSGVLMGRVVDDEGRPMRRAQVQAFVSVDTGGRRQMLRRGNAVVTNDRGEFRLFWLEPAAYYIVVTPPQLWPDLFRPPVSELGYIPNDPDASFVTTYFPGTSDINKAQRVQVGSGEMDVHAIPMAALRTKIVRGRISGSSLEGTFGLLSVSIFMPGEDAYVLKEERIPFLRTSFDFKAGLEPGEYRIAARLQMPKAVYVGTSILRVGDDDSIPVDIPVLRGISVQGRIQIDGTGQRDEIVRSASILAVLKSNKAGISVRSDVKTNGNFVLDAVLPERYRIEVRGLPENAYVAKVAVQNRDVDPEAVDFPEGIDTASMAIVIKQK